MFLTKKHTVFALALAVSTLLSSCSEPTTNAEGNTANTQPANTEHRWSKEHKKHPEWPMEIREEVYGDADTFSTPRLMFWGKFKGSKITTLWSSRLDGSDRRRIIPEKFFTQIQRSGLHTPSRSPDNRYIAISEHKNDKPTRQLYDTKEKKLIFIAEGGGYPSFNWTSDSENVIFYADGKHYNYHVPTAKLTKRKTIYSKGLFLLPGDKEFLAMRHDGFWIHKFDGELVRKVDFGFLKKWRIKDSKISPDGKYIGFMTHGRANFHFHWININNPKLEKSVKGDGGGVIFSPQEDHMLKYTNKLTGEVTSRGFHLSNKIIRQTNIITSTTEDKLLKEHLIWGLFMEGPLIVFNYKDYH